LGERDLGLGEGELGLGEGDLGLGFLLDVPPLPLLPPPRLTTEAILVRVYDLTRLFFQYIVMLTFFLRCKENPTARRDAVHVHVRVQ
jgi:hypothetical protein